MTIGTGAIKKGIEQAVAATSTSVTGALAAKLRRWRATSAIRTVTEQLDQVRMVKTIWQVDKAVDLLDFYYPSKLLFKKKRVEVSHLSDFPCSGNVVIQGTVGQGKSIFLRYLTVVESVDGTCIPLFIELRRLDSSKSFVDNVVAELTALGLAADSDVFQHLATTGRLFLFLDAFDEVKEERRESLIQELEQLAKAFKALRIIITSRPRSGIERSPHWDVVELAPLENREHEAVIKRLCHDVKTANVIIDGLRNQRITAVLTTPLMVALLLLRFRADQSIPENQTAFFSDLFMLLLQRHDKSKAGYVRTRKSKAGDKGLERVFCAMCFLTKKRGELSFSGQVMYEVTQEALKLTGITADVDAVLDDIETITCLLLEEGGEYRYIHKIVQEYHTACFVAQSANVSATEFYKAMLLRSSSWEEELGFLETLDTYRCLKFFVLPMLTGFFGSTVDLAKLVPDVLRWFDIVVAERKTPISGFHLSDVNDSARVMWLFSRAVKSGFRLGSLMLNVPKNAAHVARVDGGLRFYNLSRLAAAGVEPARLEAGALALLRALQKDLEEAQSITRRFEAQRSIMSFD